MIVLWNILDYSLKFNLKVQKLLFTSEKIVPLSRQIFLKINWENPTRYSIISEQLLSVKYGSRRADHGVQLTLLVMLLV